MSTWKELKKVVNSNFNKPLNEQIKEQLINMQFYSGELITASTTWTVPKTGFYKIICVGKGASGTNMDAGAAGGVVVERAELTKGDSYSITIGKNASFGTFCKATGASGTKPGSGTVTNGVIYEGNAPYKSGQYGENGGDVGLYDIKYMANPMEFTVNTDITYLTRGGRGLFTTFQNFVIQDAGNGFSGTYMTSGGNGYGAGGGVIQYADSNYAYIGGSGGPACVYIELVCELKE